MADTTYHFLSYVRTGFAASLTQADTFGAAQPALATAPVGVAVSGVAQPVTHNATVRGPGDVVGIARSQVVRTDPVDGAVGFEPNYFGQIEFDRPDLPWLFTPAKAVGERLRPWVVLVVVDLDGPHPCDYQSGSPLPRLHVPTEAAAQLPDLATSWLWAHSQVVTPNNETVAAALSGDPRLSISRLMCPRHLEPFRWYLAAVVPSFNVGRLAGLGQTVTADDEQSLAPAWQPGGEVVLPVYYSWRFRTGEDADFEALARKLKGRPLPDGVGTRSLDVSRPGAGLPSFPVPLDVNDTSAIVWLDGALRRIDSDLLPARDPAAEQAFRTSLTVLLDRPAELIRNGGVDPVIAPPIYGDKHALTVELGSGTPPPWLAELNLDARTRVAAGLGTQVVQARQDDYVARAWRQLGDVLAANRLLRAAQLARSGSLRVHDRLATLDAPTLLGIASPAHSRILGAVAAGATLAKSVTDSRLPNIAIEPAFRRLVRPSTAVSRAANVSALGSNVVERFATQAFAAAVDGPDGATAMRPAVEVIGSARASAALAAIGDTAPDDANRFDVALSTLNANAKAFPTGDVLMGAPRRADVGAVALMTSLGAVPAAAISEILTAAAESPPPVSPPGEPPVFHPPPVVEPPLHHPPGGPPVFHPPPVVEPPLHHPPGGPPVFHPPPVVIEPPLHHPPVVGPLPHPPGGPPVFQPLEPPVHHFPVHVPPVAVFHPSGPTVELGHHVALHGGSIVIDNATVKGLAAGTTHAFALDDTKWSALIQHATVPKASVTADPVVDAGTRLDAFRRDPAALQALAEVATGSVESAMTLDQRAGELSTSGAAATAFGHLATGGFNLAVPDVKTGVTGAADHVAANELLLAAKVAIDRMVDIGDSPARPDGPVFDLAAARTGLLSRTDPEKTTVARVRVRLNVKAIAGVVPRDDLDPVMASPQFNDPMWQALRDLGHGWLLPGLEKVPPDTATLVRTNPTFVAAHMVGLNHEMMRELLWREYPTDQRGTPFHRFWGRVDNTDDIGPVHAFRGELLDNLLSGRAGEAVLLLRSELLRRYPGSIIYLSHASDQNGDLLLHGDPVLPSFRGDLPPDVSFVGFPITPDALRDHADPWWFVIAQPPAEPRFGLDDPAADTLPVPATANDLAWSHVTPDGNAATPAPFAIADPPLLHNHPIDGVLWGAAAAVQAHLTYQHPVQVAIRAFDLLPQQPPPGGPPPDGGPPP